MKRYSERGRNHQSESHSENEPGLKCESSINTLGVTPMSTLMNRQVSCQWMYLLLMVSVIQGVSLTAEEKPGKEAFLSAAAAGPDFKIQGEYAGRGSNKEKSL